MKKRSLSIMKKPYIFLISFGILSTILAVQTYLCLKQNGMFTYPLDDSYIHMAIAKNIAKHGVWGVTRFEFTAASSSILYSLLLSFFFFILGVHVWIPLAINWITAAFVLYFIIKWCGNYMSASWTLIFSIIFIFLVPLPSIVLMGMEHTLHVLFSLIFIYITFKKLSGENISNSLYFFVAVLVVGARYEGVFLVGITALIWMFVQKRMAIGFLLILGLLLPISIFGIYSILHGGFFLPNSLLIKGVDASHSISQFLTSTLTKIYDTGLIYSFLFIPCIYLFLFPLQKNNSFRSRPLHLICIIIAGACLAHFLLARFGKPYRYGAYLVAMELMLIAAILKPFFFHIQQKSLFIRVALLGFSLFLLLPIFSRFGASFYSNKWMQNIYDQQIAMAFFVQKYFPKTTIVLNDIGAVAFYNNDVHIFDFVGLSNTDVIKYHTPGNSSFLKDYTAKDSVQIGLFYPDWIGWLGYTKPADWECVGHWYLKNNDICGNPDVGIFVMDSTIRKKMIHDLRAFSSELSPNVRQSGVYFDNMENYSVKRPSPDRK